MLSSRYAYFVCECGERAALLKEIREEQRAPNSCDADVLPFLYEHHRIAHRGKILNIVMKFQMKFKNSSCKERIKNVAINFCIRKACTLRTRKMGEGSTPFHDLNIQ